MKMTDNNLLAALSYQLEQHIKVLIGETLRSQVEIVVSKALHDMQTMAMINDDLNVRMRNIVTEMINEHKDDDTHLSWNDVKRQCDERVDERIADKVEEVIDDYDWEDKFTKFINQNVTVTLEAS